VGYSPGDKGTILEGPKTLPGHLEPFYLVVMDTDGTVRTIPFNAEEIEPDL
jgi:hypothetical protein